MDKIYVFHHYKDLERLIVIEGGDIVEASEKALRMYNYSQGRNLDMETWSHNYPTASSYERSIQGPASKLHDFEWYSVEGEEEWVLRQAGQRDRKEPELRNLKEEA